MNDQENFENLPANAKIRYEHFLFYLEEGRELEFLYKGKEYFISNSSLEGRALWTGKIKLSEFLI